MANYQSTHTGAEIDAGIDLLDKNTATQGQVLTADGNGGAIWKDASGGSGGTSLFKHKIGITYNDYTGYCTIINNKSTEMSIEQIASEDGELNIIMKKHVISGEPGSMAPREVHTAFLQITGSAFCFFTTALTETVTSFWHTSLTVTDNVTPL